MNLTTDQQVAKQKIIQAVSNSQEKVVLKGYAGTGKSVVVKELIQELTALGYLCYVCTPTHKAASVLRNRGVDASTIHRKFFCNVPMYKLPGEKKHVSKQTAIEWVRQNKKMSDYPDIVALLTHALDGFNTSEFNNVPAEVLNAIEEDFLEQAIDKLKPELVHVLSYQSIANCKDTLGSRKAVLIVDESSMLGEDVVDLLEELYTEFRAMSSIIFVGDDFQLPPVESCELENGEINSFFIDVKADATLTEVLRTPKTEHYGPLHFATSLRKKYNTRQTAKNRLEEQSNFLPPAGLDVMPLMAKNKFYATTITYTNRDRVLLNNHTRRALHGDKYKVWPLPGDRIIAETSSTDGQYIKGSEYSVVSFDPETCVIEVLDLATDESSRLYFSGAKAYLSFSKVLEGMKFPNKDISDSRDYFNKIKIAETREKDRLSKAESKARVALAVESEKLKIAIQTNGAAQKHAQLIAAEKALTVAKQERLVFTSMPRVSFDFAFALTCHKAQGSEFDTCIVLDRGQDGDNPRWIYTACTRVKRTLYWCKTIADVKNLMPIKNTSTVNDGWP